MDRNRRNGLPIYTAIYTAPIHGELHVLQIRNTRKPIFQVDRTSDFGARLVPRFLRNLLRSDARLSPGAWRQKALEKPVRTLLDITAIRRY